MLRKFLWARSLSIGLVSLLAWSFLGRAVPAQEILPDNTLGNESSVVESQRNGASGNDAFISGGATRATNLFHSFESFDIGEKNAAYFVVDDPTIVNIFSRVTGNGISNILGVLGSRSERTSNFPSTANLYLMNPNGIIFGPNAQLNLGGDLVVTTSDAVQFGDIATFNARSPNFPSSLLTINPSAFLFSQVEIPPSIVSQSAIANIDSPEFLDGLRISDGRSLLFVGGDIQLQNSVLTASGGRVDLAAVNGDGLVDLDSSDRSLSLILPETLELGDILFNSSTVNVNGSIIQPTSGDIQISGRRLNLNSSRLQSNNFGSGTGNSIAIDASDLTLDNSAITTATFTTAPGGNIDISTNLATFQNGSQITTGSLAGMGGNSGNVRVNATGDVNVSTMSNLGSLFVGGLSSEERGTSGSIEIQAENISFEEGASILSSTLLGQGEAGNIVLTANDAIKVSEGFLSSSSWGDNASGSIALNADTLLIENSASVVTSAFDPILFLNDNIIVPPQNQLGFDIIRGLLQGIDPGQFGQRDSGAIIVNANSTAKLTGGGQIQTSTFGRGNGGEISIFSDELILEDSADNRSRASGVISESAFDSNGRTGNINVSTRLLSITGGANISNRSLGSGAGGNLTVTARESTEISGSVTISNNQGTSLFRSGLISSTSDSGRAGDVMLETSRLSISEGGGIEAGTFGAGRAGDIDIVSNSISLSGVQSEGAFQTSISSETNPGTTGSAGNILISTRTLDLREGAGVSTATFGTGEGGNLNITATESTNIVGSNEVANDVFTGPVRSSLRSIANGSGQAGNITLNTGRLSIAEGGGIETITFRTGDAGDITVVADGITLQGVQTDKLFPSAITSESAAVENAGSAGDVNISTSRLNIQEGALITSATSGMGTGGNLTITATESTNITGSSEFRNGQSVGVIRSSLVSNTGGDGQAGNIILHTGRLSLSGGGGIEAATFGSGGAGSININADAIKLSGVQADGLFQTSINSETALNVAGDAGNIHISARTLDIQEGAGISAATFGAGAGGNLDITATESTRIIGSNNLASSTFTGPVRSIIRSSTTGSNRTGSNRAGNVKLSTGQLSIRSGGGIEAATAGTGDAGDIEVVADQVTLEGTLVGTLLSSTITSEAAVADANANRAASVVSIGNAGAVTVSARKLDILNGAVISTATFGSSRGGSLTINSTESINLSGISPRVENQAIGSSLLTSTAGSGAAGSLQINAHDLQVEDGGLILASSFSSGNAGNILVSADTIELRGTALDGQIRSGIGSSSDTGTGNAGNINVSGRSLSIEDRAIINTTAAADGLGGNIDIRLTDPLDANQGDISSAVSSTRGGNINIEASALRFRNDSNIFTTSNTGNGGDITIAAPGIVLIEDSDIFAFAPQGEGGNISFDTRALLTDSLFRSGAEAVVDFESGEVGANLIALDINGRVDINASGTVSGQVSETPDITFLENSTADISSAFLDADMIISNSCIARRDGQSGTFSIIGTDRFQSSANNTTSYPTGTVNSVTLSSVEAPGHLADEPSAQTIEEPQDIYRLADGRLIMSKPCL